MSDPSKNKYATSDDGGVDGKVKMHGHPIGEIIANKDNYLLLADLGVQIYQVI